MIRLHWDCAKALGPVTAALAISPVMTRRGRSPREVAGGRREERDGARAAYASTRVDERGPRAAAVTSTRVVREMTPGGARRRARACAKGRTRAREGDRNRTGVRPF